MPFILPYIQISNQLQIKLGVDLNRLGYCYARNMDETMGNKEMDIILSILEEDCIKAEIKNKMTKSLSKP
jgi:hypothetical protein